MARREAMASVDRAWLVAERPTNPMVINALWIFQETIDYRRLMQTLAARILSHRRFRQRVVQPSGSIGHAFWEDDPHFDLRAHVHRIVLPAPGNKAILEEFVSNVVSDPLDPSKPFWEFYLIENYERGSVVLGRIHHCIADGVALVRVMLSLTDPTPLDSWQDRASHRPRRRWHPLQPLLRSVSEAVNTAATISSTLLAEGVATINNPSHLFELVEQSTVLAGKTAAVLGKLALMAGDDRTLFKGELGTNKRVAWSDGVALDDVKFVKNRTGTTVNDVLVAAITGGLRRYMLARHSDPADKEVRAMVPVNIRPTDEQIELGNQFALVYLSLPVGIEDPLERLFEVKRRMDRIKQSPEAMVTYKIITGLGLAPSEVAGQITEYFASKASAVLTNVPGPQQKLYLAGSRIDKMIAWVPQSGSIGMGLSILSYGGEVVVGVITDDNLIPNPDGIVAGFHAEFEQLHQIACQPDIENVVPQEKEAKTPLAPVEERSTTPFVLQRGTNGAEQPVNARDADAVAEALLRHFLTIKEEAQGKIDAEPGLDRCQAKTRAGARCKLRVQVGSHYCHLHQPQAAYQAQSSLDL